MVCIGWDEMDGLMVLDLFFFLSKNKCGFIWAGKWVVEATYHVWIAMGLVWSGRKPTAEAMRTSVDFLIYFRIFLFLV